MKSITTADIYIVAFSGGKDSIAMVLHLLSMGIPKYRIELHHHEVDGRGEPLFDWNCTTSYCKAFAAAFDLPIYFSYRSGGIVREMFRKNETVQPVYYQNELNGEMICLQPKVADRFLNTRGKFPAISVDLQTRWCSSSVKISILNQVITHSDRYLGKVSVVCTGERRAESAARAKYSDFELHTSDAKKRTVFHWRPVLEFSDNEVWNLLRDFHVQPHPSYMLGWGRCSCQLCIFGSPNIWATLYEIDKPKIERIAEIEVQLNHTLHHKNTIMQIVARGKSFYDSSNEYWLNQALGEFTAPIFVDKWINPLGMGSKEKSGSL